ncbi:MAG: serine/threonine protein phosphatase [Lewinella sp.]|nr:serine/threonine protein phosphatase [Lewinella sp.]
MQRFAITDIHGCARTFATLLDQLALSAGDELYLLGDYIDRGPDSRRVIDLILESRSAGIFVTCLRGNHEQLLLDALTDPIRLGHFRKNGGLETMASFGVRHPAHIPPQYLQFFESLTYYIDLPGEYLMVHAGVDFSHPQPLADHHSLLYLRPWDMRLDREWLAGRVLLHGHTPIQKTAVEIGLAGLANYPELNLDAGCVYPDLGHLCALDLDRRELTFVAYCG